MTNTKLGCIWRDGCNQHDTCQQAGCCQGLRSNREMVIPDQEYEGPLKCSNCKRPLSEHAGIVCPELPPSNSLSRLDRIGVLLDKLPQGEALRYYHAGRELLDAREALQALRATSEPPAEPIFPVARLYIDEEENVSATLYDPGLPPGNHDVYPAASAPPPFASPEHARTLAEWSEAQGPVVWWAPPVREPSYIGQPGDSDWPGYHTHWTPHPKVPANIKEQQCVCGEYFLGPDAVELRDSRGGMHYPKNPCTAPTKASEHG